MSEFDALRSRVEETAARLAVTQSDRRERNQSLLETLARLETKFAAQEQELVYYRERIRPLEAANVQLSALMGRLLDMVDTGLGEADDPEDPVRAATAMAAAMLDRDLIPLPAQPADAPAVATAADGAEPHFDDVGEAELVAELSDEAGDGDLPSLVRVAAAVAAAVPMEDLESVDALADALGAQAADSDPLHPTAADIRALLERVEAAAAQVRATDAEAAPQTARTATLPDRRTAGAAA